MEGNQGMVAIMVKSIWPRAAMAFIVAACVLSTASLRSQTGSEPRPPTHKVEMLDTEARQLTSTIAGQEYDLWINLPWDYRTTTKTFPVVYVLDAAWDFPLVAGLLPGQNDDGLVPELIVVGITWGGATPNYDTLRMRDFTPTKSGPVYPDSGNGPRFLAFLRQELIPFIDAQYRTTKGDRGLVGSSAGGLFGLYALFHDTGLFNRYVLTSPNFGWDNGVAVGYEPEYAKTHASLPVNLFLGLGELEGGKIPQFQDFIATVKSRNYQGLKLDTMLIPDSGHSSNRAEGFLKGLRAVYAPAPLAVDPRVLDTYVGSYRGTGPGTTILREGPRLFFVAPDGGRFPLNALTPTDFSVRGIQLLLRFKTDEHGQVTGYDAERPGRSPQFIAKVK
jgi:predicted alpha/beta superfamily hydrolase